MNPRTLFSRAFIGSIPQVMIADTDLLKQIMVKEFDVFIDRTVRVLSLVL